MDRIIISSKISFIGSFTQKTKYMLLNLKYIYIYIYTYFYA